MRSLSFGKKSSSSSSSSSSKDGKPAMVAVSATRRTFVLERGPQGLGLELDSTNTIITVKPGGRAEQQGLVQLDDVILSVDGKSCTGKLMQEVMVPGRPVYVVEILRQEKKEAPVATPMKAMNAIRRSMSFDKKPSGGSVKRTMSWTTKKFG
jgi:C-terminal processing protease CtpA/Prc